IPLAKCPRLKSLATSPASPAASAAARPGRRSAPCAPAPLSACLSRDGSLSSLLFQNLRCRCFPKASSPAISRQTRRAQPVALILPPWQRRPERVLQRVHLPIANHANRDQFNRLAH